MIVEAMLIIVAPFIVATAIILFADWVLELRRARNYYRRRWIEAAIDARDAGCQQYRLFTDNERRSS